MWPDPQKTRDILNDVRNGDDEAINRLFARHREAVRRMISQRLDPQLAGRLDASDVVQEVLIEASRRLPDYLDDPAMPFHLWLRHLARDHVIGAYRRHRAARKRSVDRELPLAGAGLADQSSLDLAPHLVASGLTPAAAAIRKELEQRFRAAISSLGEDDREIIFMRHFEQLSNQDVATALELSEAAAGMRHLRALRRLRAILSNDRGGAS